MIVNMALKRIADFHGHLCPDLVLGVRLCERVLELVPSEENGNGLAAVIAENCTSALDAIQIMLGITLGNQRLKVMNFGKHNYTIIPKKGASGFRFVLNVQSFDNEDAYRQLSAKMLDNKISTDEVAMLQTCLDQRVKYLLGLPREALFAVESIEKDTYIPEIPSVYLTCCQCGQPMLGSHAIRYQGKDYCISCMQRMNPDGSRYCVH
ncbi:FmdE family protein [uncultured Desulfosarcina sp.]|uniref:FmdE family protein n=1 Tax=uncultured Desulfosarcina sp. TaxID=218289 RepID=UPI0029C743B7|nr:FmdE family protein [uncultured Desulfosarcina sp.]